MGIGTVATKLPLATWARIVGIHPLHFEGVEYTPSGDTASVCQAAWPQYSWQANDRISREQIAEAILQAETVIEDVLNYKLAPTWEANEWQVVGRPYQRELVNHLGRSIGGLRSAVQLKWGKLIAGGIETKTKISTPTIAWSDADGDGYKETGTVTAPVASGTPPCELELYYPGKDGAAEFQIRPIIATVAGITATITFRRELAIQEDLLEALDYAPADATDDADFLATVDVYRHWNDPSQQAMLLWEPTGCGGCGGNGCAACSYAAQMACLYSRIDPDSGLVAWTPGEWDNDTDTFVPGSLALGRSPELIRLWYYAGNQATRGCPTVMDQRWARAVTHLSLSYLDRPICDCTANEWAFWREDFAATRGAEGETYYQISKANLDNPFGTRRGAIAAWNMVTGPNVALSRGATLV